MDLSINKQPVCLTSLHFGFLEGRQQMRVYPPHGTIGLRFDKKVERIDVLSDFTLSPRLMVKNLYFLCASYVRCGSFVLDSICEILHWLIKSYLSQYIDKMRRLK